jgi:predicted extracellular nuclease
MGTVRWDLASYGKNRGSGAATVIGEFTTSGNHTSSTTASDITDGAAGAGSAVTAAVGDVLHITCDELARVVIGGGTATATSGFLLQPDIARDIEITTAGTISVIDEA